MTVDHATTHRPNFYVRLRDHWGVTNWGMIAILLAFSLAGSVVVRIAHPIVDFILPATAPKWLWWTVRILLIVPLYEVILVLIGTMLGQGPFFRDKQRRLLRRLAKPFRRAA